MELLREKQKGNLYILTHPSGTPWNPRTFKKAWGEAIALSGITDDLHFHDLRGTAVSMLAEAGCTVPEICSITGHTLKSATQILELYLSRTRSLATTGIVKLNEHSRNKNRRV